MFEGLFEVVEGVCLLLKCRVLKWVLRLMERKLRGGAAEYLYLRSPQNFWQKDSKTHCLVSKPT